MSTEGLGHALRRLRDPVLLLLPCPSCSRARLAYGHGLGRVGFDFRGTLWEPARALLDGDSDLPRADTRGGRGGEPGRVPAVAFILASVAARAPAGVGGLVALVRRPRRGRARLDVDPRGARLALPRARRHVAGRASRASSAGTSPCCSLLPLALGVAVSRAGDGRGHRGRVGRRREAVRLAARRLAALDAALPRRRVGRRRRRPCWCSARGRSSGSTGCCDYPTLLREIQDVYAMRSDSIAGVAGGLGASCHARRRVAAGSPGLRAVGARRVARAARPDGDRKRVRAARRGRASWRRRSSWPNYAALLFVPIASHVAPARARRGSSATPSGSPACFPSPRPAMRRPAPRASPRWSGTSAMQHRPRGRRSGSSRSCWW